MIAIHNVKNSFTDRWEVYCQQQSIVYSNIDIFSSGIIARIRNEKIDKILFDVTLYDIKTRIAALAIVRSIETLGVDVFPGCAELWHFDDKIAQKYLFESLAIPCCLTSIFYDREHAREWAKSTTYPNIFKLKCGAGSSNVIMVKSFAQAERLINQMFGEGLRSVPTLLSDLHTKANKHNKNRDWYAALKRLPSTIRNIRDMHHSNPRERGYVCFQSFMPGNSFDTRVTVIGDRAFAFRRMVRKDDFRASGSGNIDWNIEAVDLNFVKLAFDASARIGARCMAYDLIYGPAGAPVIIECCYKFIPEAVHACPGYWDQSLKFHFGNYYPQDLIAEDFLHNLKAKS